MISIEKDKILLDGKPFQIISGSFHYFRTCPEYWRDRLIKIKNMGCNTVETYIPWNFHEPHKNEFLWSGWQDIEGFIRLAAEVGLYMIIRPSPYICAEWEFGGLPAWLLSDRNMRVRCCYKPYLDAVDSYYRELIPRLAPYQQDRGGNILLFQIENEYGYYGNDKEYLKFLADTMRKYGLTMPFVTSDGPWNKDTFCSGMLDNTLATGNFGSSMKWQLDTMQEIIGEKPLMCMEFWVGWFDAWGEEHHGSDLEQNKADLDEALSRGHVNFYMLEGGTNFGFMNGRNEDAKTGDVTSYDYDAPLSENGQITPKYKAFKDIIGKYTEIKEAPTEEIPRMAYGELKCCAKVSLLDTLDRLCNPVTSPYPLTMEEAGQNYGYILYRIRMNKSEAPKEIKLEGASDRVICFIDKEKKFTAFDDTLNNKFEVSGKQGAVVDLLVENCGRVNFGKQLNYQRKGICGGVIVNSHLHFGYEIYPLEFTAEQLKRLDFEVGYVDGTPSVSKFSFKAEKACDTFVDMSGFGKGCVFVNGFNLGRYWSIGPQKRLYLPAPLLKIGDNEIIVLETEGITKDSITLFDTPDLG